MTEVIRAKSNIKFDEILSNSSSYLFVCFPKSPSKNYPLVMSIIGEKYLFGVTENSGIALTVARFDVSDGLQSNIAMSALDLMRNWKGVMIIFDGKFLFSHLDIASILSCQGIARNCDNHLAHCTTIKDIYLDSSYERRLRVVFPCVFMSGYFQYQEGINATLGEQIQALSARKGVSICPYFSMDNFKSGEIKLL